MAFRETPSQGEEQTARKEVIRDPKPVAQFVVGTVVEQTVKGVTKKYLEVFIERWRKKKYISEDVVPEISGVALNEVLVFEKKPRARDETLKKVEAATRYLACER